MKSKIDFVNNQAFRSSETIQSGRRFPVTNYQFQPEAGSLTAGGGVISPSAKLHAFRQISGGFLRQENNRSFAKEGALFAVLAVISAWPIANMVSALVSLLR